MEILEFYTGSDRLEFLGYDVIALVSSGKKESVDDVIKHLEEGDMIHYLVQKYKENFMFIEEGYQYNLNDWDKLFKDYSYLSFNSDVRRKMGIVNEDDGLLVLLNIIMQVVSERKYNIQ